MQPDDEIDTPAPPRAGLLRRIAAMVYDSLLLFGVLYLATSLLLAFNDGEAIAPGNALYSVYLLVVAYLYFAWFWTHGGRTLGMRAWHLRLTREEGGDVGWGQALARFAAAILSFAAAGLGFAWSLADRERRTWHDLLSRSRLVVDRGRG